MKRMPLIASGQRIRAREVSSFVRRMYQSLRPFVRIFTVSMPLILLTVVCGQEEPDNGALHVASTPDSARIVLDGGQTGNLTPHLFADISPGEHAVRVERADYRAVPESLNVLVLPTLVDSVYFELTPEAGFGAVFVTSAPESALILLDGASTDAFTPDTLRDISAGFHWVEVERMGYVTSPESLQVLVRANETVEAVFELTLAVGRPVLLESFTNTSCEPCAEVNPMMYELMDELGLQQAVLMEFHTSFPSPIDPFYYQQTELMNARVAHYGVSQAPWVVVEGTEGLQPSSSDVVSAAIEAAEPLEDVLLLLDGELNGTTLSCSLEVSAPQTPGSYGLSVFVTHDRIEFEEAPGSNGETIFRHVVRAGLTPPGGTEVDLSEETELLSWTTVLGWLTPGEGVEVVAVATEPNGQQVRGLAVKKLP